MPPETLRDRINDYLESQIGIVGSTEADADAILALVRAWVTSDAAVERAAMAWDTYTGSDDEALRAALAAALD